MRIRNPSALAPTHVVQYRKEMSALSDRELRQDMAKLLVYGKERGRFATHSDPAMQILTIIIREADRRKRVHA